MKFKFTVPEQKMNATFKMPKNVIKANLSIENIMPKGDFATKDELNAETTRATNAESEILKEVRSIETEIKNPDKNFVFQQSIASNEWVVTHNLKKFPAVVVVDSANTEILCECNYVDLNTCILKFSASFKGYAYFN